MIFSCKPCRYNLLRASREKFDFKYSIFFIFIIFLFLVINDEFQFSPVDVIGIVSEDVLINCIPPDSYPVPIVTWLKNGIAVNGNRFAVQDNGSLLITGSEFNDGGSYTCVAVNDYLNITRTSAPASLLIYRE